MAEQTFSSAFSFFSFLFLRICPSREVHNRVCVCVCVEGGHASLDSLHKRLYMCWNETLSRVLLSSCFPSSTASWMTSHRSGWSPNSRRNLLPSPHLSFLLHAICPSCRACNSIRTPLYPFSYCVYVYCSASISSGGKLVLRLLVVVVVLEQNP